MTAWILSLIVLLVPHSPWEGTYEDTARAIDLAAHEHPLYAGAGGPERTAIELVVLSFFESHFDPNAVKDDDGGDSLGLAQINVSNLRALGMTREELFTPDGNLRAALRLMAESHRTCRARPWKQQLAAYATGRGLCGVPAGVRASEHRLEMARELLRTHPPVWTSTAIDVRTKHE